MSDFLNVLVVGVLLGGIYSLVSIGLNLIFGVIRVVNFAQGEFVMLGMYATYAAFSFLNMDPYVAIVLVFPSLFVFGVFVQRFIVQPLQAEPMMQVFATFGLLMIFQNAVLALTRGAARQRAFAALKPDLSPRHDAGERGSRAGACRRDG